MRSEELWKKSAAARFCFIRLSLGRAGADGFPHVSNANTWGSGEAPERVTMGGRAEPSLSHPQVRHLSPKRGEKNITVSAVGAFLAAARSPLGSNSPKGLLFSPSRPLRYPAARGPNSVLMSLIFAGINVNRLSRSDNGSTFEASRQTYAALTMQRSFSYFFFRAERKSTPFLLTCRSRYDNIILYKYQLELTRR